MNQPSLERDLLLVSVQRTGTRFTQRILTAAKIKTAQIHPVQTRTNQLDNWLKKNTKQNLPIIVSLRHPISVALSWRSREDSVEKMFDQWAYLVQIIAVSKPLFLPVDHPEKQEYLDELSRYVGKPLETDWKKYGNRPVTPPAELSSGEIDQCNQLVATTFLSDFYEDVPHGT